MSELGIFYPNVPSGGNTQMRYYRGTVANPFGDAPPEDIVAICNGTIGTNLRVIAKYHLTGAITADYEAACYYSTYDTNLYFTIGTLSPTGGIDSFAGVTLGWDIHTDGTNVHRDKGKIIAINNGEITDMSGLIKDTDTIELFVYTDAE